MGREAGFEKREIKEIREERQKGVAVSDDSGDVMINR